MTDAIPDVASAESLQGLLQNISTPAELRELLDTPGVDDKTIEEFVTAIGAEQVLDRVFGLMGAHFVAARAGAESGVVQWDVKTGGDVASYHLTIADGAAVGERGAAPGAKVTLTVTAPTLLRLCSGRLDGVTGFTTGKIKLAGDLMFGAKMATWFDY